MSAPEKPLGMYGLRIGGLAAEAKGSLVPVADDSPEVAVSVALGTSLVALERRYEGRVIIAAERGALLDIVREPPSATVLLQRWPSPRMLVHPVLSIVAAVHSRWRGALTLHGGAFAVEGRAWAVLGQKNEGKSSLMASLARRGVPVLTDDLVVVDSGHVLAGPRTVDLRPDAVEHFPEAEYIGAIGTRHRYRISLAAVPPRTPLAGFITLAWGTKEGASLRALPLGDRLRTLTNHEATPLAGPQPPELLFPALELEMLELRRPKGWDLHSAALDLLSDLGRRPESSPTPPGAGSRS
jgi:hypothetical protein